jgi:hypothetical protein
MVRTIFFAIGMRVNLKRKPQASRSIFKMLFQPEAIGVEIEADTAAAKERLADRAIKHSIRLMHMLSREVKRCGARCPSEGILRWVAGEYAGP